MPENKERMKMIEQVTINPKISQLIGMTEILNRNGT